MFEHVGDKNAMNTIIMLPCKLLQNNSSLPVIVESTSELLMCRTCATTQPKRNLLPLFERPQLHEHYSRSLLNATGLQIKMNDGLPQHICNTCSDTIKNVLSFRKSCEMAHKVIEATFKRKMPQSAVKIEKSADEFETKQSDVMWSNTKLTIKVEKEEQDIKTYESNVTSQDIKRKVNTRLIKFDSDVSEKKDVSLKINNDIKPLTKYVDVELTPMFHDSESLEGEEDFPTNSKSKYVCGKIKIRAGVDATADTSGNSRKSSKSLNTRIIRERLLAQYLDESAALYTCNECKRCYASKGSFVTHTQVHTGFKVMCEECSKVFRNTTSLTIHQRCMHNKSEKLKCPHCDYCAASNNRLKIHIRKHTGERPYVCDTCASGFRSQELLTQHLSAHITEKTIQCEQCPSMFASRFHLKLHRYKAHKPRRWSYQCPRCPKIYLKTNGYRKHMRNLHGVPMKDQEKPIRVPSGLGSENKDKI